MAYQTLAQKYRPGDFSEIVGQESATRTLINSIKKARVANAYMFCGPRGTGKTSMARLLSKTLNCEQAGNGSPCNKCDSCREISQGNSIDVLEIDGASNNGIEEIRTLRENVKFTPSKGRYRIYIIDEVHMLSTPAFNALLKTLEEPPEHVKFIFATTEPHNVLPTIMSRCQRFDFRKIPPAMIHKKIKEIADSEGIKISDPACILLVRSADGSLRDALVVLDQVVSFSKGKIEADDVAELLGMIEGAAILELAGAVINKNPEKAIRMVDELVSAGKDPVFINSSLISHFRDLMVVKAIGEPSSDMAMSDEETEAIMSQKASVSLEEILYILQNLTHCTSLMRWAAFARGPFEVALIRMAKRDRAMKLTELMDRIEALERKGVSQVEISGAPSGGVVSGSEVNPDVTGSGLHSSGIPEAGGENVDSIPDGGDTSPGYDDFDGQRNRWKTLLNYVKNRKMSVFVFLSSAQPLEMSGDTLVIGFNEQDRFNNEALQTGSNKSVLQEAADKVMGQPVRISFKTLDSGISEQKDSAEKQEKKNRAKENMKPVVEKAMDILGGRVVRDFMEGV